MHKNNSSPLLQQHWENNSSPNSFYVTLYSGFALALDVITHVSQSHLTVSILFIRHYSIMQKDYTHNTMESSLK